MIVCLYTFVVNANTCVTFASPIRLTWIQYVLNIPLFGKKINKITLHHHPRFYFEGRVAPLPPPSILAQLAWRSGDPNGGRADQFGASAVDRDYAATLIAASVRICGLRHRRTSRLTGCLSAFTFYRKSASTARAFLLSDLPSPFVRVRLFFLHRCGFCKYWRNMAAVWSWPVICAHIEVSRSEAAGRAGRRAGSEEGKLWPLAGHLHHHHQPKQAAADQHNSFIYRETLKTPCCCFLLPEEGWGVRGVCGFIPPECPLTGKLRCFSGCYWHDDRLDPVCGLYTVCIQCLQDLLLLDSDSL